MGDNGQPVRMGVIGLGGRGRYFASRMIADNPRTKLTAVCDCNQEILALIKQKHGDRVRYYSTDAELANDPEVEAVVVATDEPSHCRNTLAVLRARKHLFLEKPMAQTIADCDRMIAAWSGSGVVFMIGLELRFASLFQEMRRIIERGDIGRIITGYAVDNVSVGGNYYFHNQRRRKDYVVSLILEKGTHTLDLVNWFVGSAPVRVFAEGGKDVFGGDAPNDKQCRDCAEADTCPYAIKSDRFLMDYGAAVQMKDGCVYARECDVSDNSIISIRYANGAKISYLECHFTPDYNREFTFIGDRGRLYGFYNNEQEFRIRVTYRHSGKIDEYFPPKMPGGHGGGDPAIMEEFLDRIASGKPSVAGVIDARNSAAIAIAAAQSEESGLPVDIPAAPAP